MCIDKFCLFFRSQAHILDDLEPSSLAHQLNGSLGKSTLSKWLREKRAERAVQFSLKGVVEVLQAALV